MLADVKIKTSKIIILSRNRNEKINHISECCKEVQKKYKMLYDGVERVIHKELCKRFKFDKVDKWYMHKEESHQEN